MEPVLSSPWPVSPLVDLLPLSLGLYRDSTPVIEGNQTVLQNPITAEYLHTLKVTGDIKGKYTCTVANNKPATIECETACILAGIFHYCINFPQIQASQALFLWQILPLLLT